MKKTLAAAILSGLFATAATASTVPSEADIKRQALAVAYKHAESIACVDPEYVNQEFMTLVPWADLYDRELAEYAVIWNGDIGCAGGSGTTGVHLSIVKVGAGNTFYVDPHKSSPVTEFEFYSSTGYDAVVANTGDVIVIDGRDYAENDGRCCPSLKVRYTLKRNEEGHWKLFNKKAL